jgi:hypothetical protein
MRPARAKVIEDHPHNAAEVVSRSDTARPHVYTQFTAVPEQVRVARSQITD